MKAFELGSFPDDDPETFFGSGLPIFGEDEGSPLFTSEEDMGLGADEDDDPEEEDGSPEEDEEEEGLDDEVEDEEPEGLDEDNELELEEDF